MMFVTYPAIFYKDVDSEGYVVVFPDFDGGATQGDSESDAVYMAQDWLGAKLYDDFVKKRPFPKASSIADIVIADEEYTIKEKSFKSLVGIDIAEYVKRVDRKTVKKTLTIPSYLNEIGVSMGVNFSQVLQDALKAEFDID